MRVLVVDDSAFHRLTLAERLRSIPGVRLVETASSGAEAIRRLLEDPWDLVTLDVVMPGMDGLTVLRWILKEKPVPVVVVTAKGRERTALEALDLGAVDVLPKPGPGDDRDVFGNRLAEAVAEARALPPERLRARRARPDTPPASAARAEGEREDARATRADVLVVAASTGGPPALHRLFALFPARDVIAAVAQHMPREFTRSFAKRLDGTGGWRVREASGGKAAPRGVVHVAPGAADLTLARDGDDVRLRVTPPRPGPSWCPSGDALFASAAEGFGSRVVAVVLTGMGTDGAEGARAVAEAGGVVLCESEDTALVDGMPAAAARAVSSARRLPLEALAGELERLL